MSLITLIISACTPQAGHQSKSHGDLNLNAPEDANPHCVNNETTNAYRLAAGDQLLVKIFGEEELSGSYPLSTTGTITMPLIGETSISGCTTKQAQEHLISRYKDGYLLDPELSVHIEKYRPFFILGEISSPGQYEYSSDLNVIKAVALAGGFTYRANQRTVAVIRQNTSQNVITLSLHAPIQPGDVITVKEKFF